MLAKFLDFWMLCSATLVAAVVLSWIGYRLRSEDLGLKGIGSEVVTALVVAAAQAGLLLMVWRVLGWTHWSQYLVAGAVCVIAYKATHAQEMEMCGPFAVALVQLALFLPATRYLAPVIGKVVRRFPKFG